MEHLRNPSTLTLDWYLLTHADMAEDVKLSCAGYTYKYTTKITCPFPYYNYTPTFDKKSPRYLVLHIYEFTFSRGYSNMFIKICNHIGANTYPPDKFFEVALSHCDPLCCCI